MILQCPDCGTKMRPKPPRGTPPDTQVQIVCRCGAKLRFRMPKPPQIDPVKADEIRRKMFGEFDPFGIRVDPRFRKH